MRRTVSITTTVLLLSVAGLCQLKLAPVRGSSEVRLSSRARTTTIDLDELLPGNAPHVYSVLFTAQRSGQLYLVAIVRSRSPISDKNAPCGGDAPRSIIWIKVDTGLKTHSLDGQIFESCSYNYYDSAVKRRRNGITIEYGRRGERMRVTYDNLHPASGLDRKKIN